jgi:hypothetical protein
VGTRHARCVRYLHQTVLTLTNSRMPQTPNSRP